MRSNNLKREVKSSSIWKNRNFLAIWLGSSLSTLTFQIYVLLLPIIIYDMTQSTFSMSSMRVIEIVPNIILGVFIGVLIDRYKRKPIMQVFIFIQLVSLAILIFIMYFSDIQLYQIYIIGFFIYLSNYVFSNAYHSILPNIAESEHLIVANSSITFMKTFITTVGPGLAGLIIFGLGYEASLLITLSGMIVLFIAITYLKVDETNTKKRNKNKVTHEIAEGWHELRNNNTLWISTVLIIIFNFASSLTGAVIIYFALENFKLNEALISTLFIGSGIGGLIGAITSKKISEKISFEKMIALTFALSIISQLLLALSFYWWFLVLGMLLMSLAVTLFNIQYMTLRQQSTPNELLGRVAGTSSMLMKLAMPVGFLVAGIMGEFIEINYIFLLSAFVLGIGALISYKNISKSIY